MKKFIAFSASLFFLTLALVPASTQAACVKDYDRDGYYSNDESGCEDTIGFKGYEPQICDCPVIKKDAVCESFGAGHNLTDTEIAEIFNPNEIRTIQRGKSFNPKAADAPGDKIDQNCDGQDAVLGNGTTTDIPALIEKAVKFLGTIVAGVSTIFLIWGAIMYASAAGEEEKTRKARKTMVGAIVGLIIGVLAATLIGIIIDQVVG